MLEHPGGRCVGIEVKAGTARADDCRGLRAFAAAAGKRFLRGVVLHAGREAVPFAAGLHAHPVDALWS